MTCYCDYDPPSVYRAARRTSRTERKCSECGRQIKPGEQYERVWGVWEGESNTFNTCSNCLALRDWVTAHIPCACWAHGNVREDAIEAAREHCDTPGLLFGAWRREVAIRRARHGETK